MKLKDLGWNDCYDNNGEGLCESGLQPARVVVVDRDRCIVWNEDGAFSADISGKFRHFSSSAADYPCAGDWVCIDQHGTDGYATITRVLPRRSFLRRKFAGKSIDYQMIGANIDVALIVQSCHFDFNVRRLERYLVMVNEGNIEPVLVLTKIDLISTEKLEQLILKIRNMGISINIIALSNVTGDGVSKIREMMIPAKTYCLVGSSGVGKSTLINQLIGHSELATKTVSETGEGRHTTVRRQLIILEQGALLIDTPGMREIGILGASDGIEDSYSNIVELSTNCRFKDCSHTREPGCAVLKAIKSGALDQEHYDNYLKIKKESEFNDMSYADKRKKDKDFGRHVNAVMKLKGSNK